MSPQARYLLINEIIPRIEAVIPRSVKLVGFEDVEEVTQDAIAIAAKMLDNVEREGKKVTVGNIAYYCLQHINSGRRSVEKQRRGCPPLELSSTASASSSR